MTSKQPCTEDIVLVTPALSCTSEATLMAPNSSVDPLSQRELRNSEPESTILEADQTTTTSACSLGESCKAAGNACIQKGDYKQALVHFSKGITTALKAPGEANQELLAALFSNRALAHSKLGLHTAAAADATSALELRPQWPKPYYRLALSRLMMGRFSEATNVCRKASALPGVSPALRKDFEGLLDRIAVAGAQRGSMAGFDGRRLEVRSAGDEAWLGRPAPYDALLDGPPAEVPMLECGGGREASGNSAGTLALVGGSAERRSFRSVKEAVAAAKDGDIIVLLKGIHNGMGESIPVDKRLLIVGEGALGETRLDQRANVPAFRLTRAAVLRNLDLDMTGFREAILVKGGAAMRPLIADCIIRCSGDDAVNTTGKAAPLFQRCTIQGRKCGLRAFGASAPVFEDCVFEECGEQGAKAMDSAKPTLRRCVLRKNGEEGVVVTDEAQLRLEACQLQDNKGPGADVGCEAVLNMEGGAITGNVGGLWLWQAARSELRGVELDGGKSHVVLADATSQPVFQDCRVKGKLFLSTPAKDGLLGTSNMHVDAEVAARFPLDEGPFVFVPNKYTRKQ